ncbi:MAG: hypothetical protein EBS97_08925 [Verrucomicrobia bacterium]|nr:hypothetical protein [Verrucomicrobiota bacterium]
MVFAGTAVPRIANSGPKDTLQGGGEGVAGGLPFGCGQPGMVPVPLGETLGKKFFHQFGRVPRGGFFQRAGGGLHHIGEGEEGGLAPVDIRACERCEKCDRDRRQREAETLDDKAEA